MANHGLQFVVWYPDGRTDKLLLAEHGPGWLMARFVIHTLINWIKRRPGVVYGVWHVVQTAKVLNHEWQNYQASVSGKNFGEVTFGQIFQPLCRSRSSTAANVPSTIEATNHKLKTIKTRGFGHRLWYKRWETEHVMQLKAAARARDIKQDVEGWKVLRAKSPQVIYCCKFHLGLPGLNYNQITEHSKNEIKMTEEASATPENVISEALHPRWPCLPVGFIRNTRR